MIDLIVILIIVALITFSILYRKNLKKKGQSSCGCDCKSCPFKCDSKSDN